MEDKKGYKEKIRDDLYEEVNDKLKVNHMPTRKNNLEEVLKIFNFQNHWIWYNISYFRIRETTTNIKESTFSSPFR